MGTRSDHVAGKIMEALFFNKNKFQTGLLADAAGAITVGQPHVLYIVPTAGRVLTMQAVTAANDGDFFIIINKSAGANDVTINNSAASGIGTISQNEGALIVCIGGAWTVLVIGPST